MESTEVDRCMHAYGDCMFQRVIKAHFVRKPILTRRHTVRPTLQVNIKEVTTDHCISEVDSRAGHEPGMQSCHDAGKPDLAIDCN